MEEKEISLVREIGRQRAINRFYRTCYSLLQELKSITADNAQRLRLLHGSNIKHETSGDSVAQEIAKELTLQEIINEMNAGIEDMRDVETQALTAWRYILEVNNVDRNNMAQPT